MLLKMRLHDSVGQRGARLKFLLYSDFLNNNKFNIFDGYVGISQERLGIS